MAEASGSSSGSSGGYMPEWSGEGEESQGRRIDPYQMFCSGKNVPVECYCEPYPCCCVEAYGVKLGKGGRKKSIWDGHERAVSTRLDGRDLRAPPEGFVSLSKRMEMMGLDLPSTSKPPPPRYCCEPCDLWFTSVRRYNHHLENHMKCKTCRKFIDKTIKVTIRIPGEPDVVIDEEICEGCREVERREMALARGAVETTREKMGAGANAEGHQYVWSYSDEEEALYGEEEEEEEDDVDEDVEEEEEGATGGNDSEDLYQEEGEQEENPMARANEVERGSLREGGVKRKLEDIEEEEMEEYFGGEDGNDEEEEEEENEYGDHDSGNREVGSGSEGVEEGNEEEDANPQSG